MPQIVRSTTGQHLKLARATAEPSKLGDNSALHRPVTALVAGTRPVEVLIRLFKVAHSIYTEQLPIHVLSRFASAIALERPQEHVAVATTAKRMRLNHTPAGMVVDSKNAPFADGLCKQGTHDGLRLFVRSRPLTWHQ